MQTNMTKLFVYFKYIARNILLWNILDKKKSFILLHLFIHTYLNVKIFLIIIKQFIFYKITGPLVKYRTQKQCDCDRINNE